MQRALNLGLPALAVLTVAVGGYVGLAVAPPDRDMNDVARIMYVHVPAAWMSLMAFMVTLVASIVYLMREKTKADAVAEASAEVGVFFGFLLVVLGSVWARPTWGVWWTWDPRLTTVTVTLLAFCGYLALRRFVEDAERRATWAAVAAIVAAAGVPLIWFSVQWWGGMHQLQSTPETVARPMATALRINAFGFLFFYLWFLRLRYQIALRRQAADLAEPPPKGGAP